MSDPRKPIFDAVRQVRGKGFTNAEVVILDHALDALNVAHASDDAPVNALPHPADPPWITIGRRLIGLDEIPGPRNNAKIVSWWAQLGAAWFNNDETPWCGLFVAHCMQAYRKGNSKW